MIVAGELQQPRMKANRRALAFEDRALQVVVHQGPRAPPKRVKGLDVAAQKALERLVEREEREEGARVRQDHHEARTAGACRGRCGSCQSCPSRPGPPRRPGRRGAGTAAARQLRPEQADQRGGPARPSRRSRATSSISCRRVARSRGYCASVSRMKGRYGSSLVARQGRRGIARPSSAIAARTVSWWTPRLVAMVPTFQCSP